jgi:hypothetical protein
MGLVAAIYLIALVVVSRLVGRLANTGLKWYFDPMFLVTAMWIVGYLVYALPIFIAREPITYEATLYVMAAHTAFFVGCMVPYVFVRRTGGAAAAGTRPAAAPDTAPMPISFRLLLVIGLVGLVGAASVTADGILSSSIGLGERLSGGALNEVRTETFERAAGLEEQGRFVRLNQFTAAAFVFIGLLFNVSLAAFGRGQRHTLVGLGVLLSLLIAFNQLFIRSGRFDIVVLLLFVFFALALGPQSTARHLLLGFVRRHRVVVATFGSIFLIGFLYLMGIVFVEGRSGGVSPLFSLYAYHRLNLTPGAADLIVGSRTMETGALTLSYIVAPLTTHSFFFGLSDAAFAGPHWGQYNFQYLTGTVMRYSGFGQEWQFFWSIRSELWRPLASLGYGTNVWATLLRDLAVDFTWAGAVFWMFLIGIVAKWLALAAVSGRYPALVVAYSFVAVFLLFSFAISTFYVTSVFPPFMYAMVLHGWLLLRRRRRPAAQDARPWLSAVIR